MINQQMENAVPGNWQTINFFIEGVIDMKCGLCDLRKAKRHCPVKNALICAQCCGEKRVLEIDCPELCPYLIAGRESEIANYTRRIGSLDVKDHERNSRVFKDHQDVIAHLEYTIARERISSRDLTDKDVAQAVDVLLDTYRTEANGVLYEKVSEDLRAEPLRRELRSVIESLRNPEGEGKGIVDPQNTRLLLSVAIDCLECIRSMVIAYQAGSHSSASGYVDFLARVLPKKDTHSSIVLA